LQDPGYLVCNLIRTSDSNSSIGSLCAKSHINGQWTSPAQDIYNISS
jgi:hypothetical protein